MAGVSCFRSQRPFQVKLYRVQSSLSSVRKAWGGGERPCEGVAGGSTISGITGIFWSGVRINPDFPDSTGASEADLIV